MKWSLLSPITIQNSSNPSSRKNLDVRPYDRTTAQGAAFNMRGQLYRRHANATALSSSSVVSALGSESDDPALVLARARRWDVREKKVRALLLGLAKSIYFFLFSATIEKTRPHVPRQRYTSITNLLPIYTTLKCLWLKYIYLLVLR